MNLQLEDNEQTQQAAFTLLQKIKHNLTDGKQFESDIDYLKEFNFPFNQSHGLTHRDVLNYVK